MKTSSLIKIKSFFAQILLAPALAILMVPQMAVAKDENNFGQIKPESSPFLARQDARKIAVKFRERGFRITPVANGDNKHSELVFPIELVKGTDCVIMVGIDEVIKDVDLYVKDEVGNMIAQDTRTINRACVQFAASYNGIYTVVVDPNPNIRLLGHFAVLAGVQNAN
jgi:hypothetical protein